MRPDKCWYSFLLGWLVACGSCSPAFAQIRLTEQRVQTFSGFINPRVVDGQVIADEGSKPLAVVKSIIQVEQGVPYKYFFIEAEQLPSFETYELQKVSETAYVLPSDAPVGTYRITAQGFDPAMARKRIDVTVGAGPTPAPVPIDDTLSPISKNAREILQSYSRAMADNFDKLSSEAALGKYKLLADAEKVILPIDLATRNKFKLDMGKLMQEHIGSGPELPAHAPKVFTDIATGFRGVR